MLFAQGRTNYDWQIALFCVLAVIIWGFLIWGGLKIYRRFKANLMSIEAQAVKDMHISNDAKKGQVRVHFHTYSGFLVVVIQREYEFWAEPQEARAALWRLHKFNCTAGLLAAGGMFIPFVSYANYLIQKRSISKQSSLSKQSISELAE